MNADSEDSLFIFGGDLLDDASAGGLVFWEDGLGNHDLDNDGKPELLYYTTLYNETDQVTERSCYVAEFENGTFVERFAEDPDEELMGVQVADLNDDGKSELCLYYFHWISTSTYTNRLVVLDPSNNYQEKFTVEHQSVQPVPYTAPVMGNGVDIDGDGVGEFFLRIYELVSTDTYRQSIEIFDGATGEMEWSKQYAVGTSAVPNLPNKAVEFGGITYPSSDFNGNGKIDFGIAEHQFDGEELLASRFAIYEFSGSTPPALEIDVATDKANYGPGEALQAKIGGRNTGANAVVDVYIAIVTPDGKICCAPSWQAGITPWIPNFNFPGGYTLSPPVAFFDPFFLPCNTPPINVAGGYLFAGALTPPGNFTFLSLDTAAFNFGM